MSRPTESDLQAEREGAMLDLLEKIVGLMRQQVETLRHIARTVERMEKRQSGEPL